MVDKQPSYANIVDELPPGEHPVCAQHKKDMLELGSRMDRIIEEIGTSPDVAGKDEVAKAGTGMKKMLVEMLNRQAELKQQLEKFDSKRPPAMASVAPQHLGTKIGMWLVAIVIGAQSMIGMYREAKTVLPSTPHGVMK